jgi:hypothetical protein
MKSMTACSITQTLSREYYNNYVYYPVLVSDEHMHALRTQVLKTAQKLILKNMGRPGPGLPMFFSILCDF